MKKQKKITAIYFIIIVWFIAFLASQFTIPGIIVQGLLFELIPCNNIISIVLLGVVCLVFLIFAVVRNRGILIGLIIFLFVGLLPLNGSLWFARDHSRNERMKELQRGLDELRLKENLPKTLDEMPFLQKYSSGLFGIDRIVYEIHGNNYIIRSYGVPLGPFELYSSERAEWYYEE